MPNTPKIPKPVTHGTLFSEWVMYEHKNNPSIRYLVHPEDHHSSLGFGNLSADTMGVVRIRCPRNVAFDSEDAPPFRMADGGVMPAGRFHKLYRTSSYAPIEED